MSEKPKIQSSPTPAASPPLADSQPRQVRGADAPQFALVVDDELANRDFLIRLLQQARLDVHGASNGAEALKIAEGVAQMALIVVDNRLPDMDGIELLARLRKQYPGARLVMATVLDERALMTRAFENGCDVFMVKPHGFMELFRRWQTTTQTGEDRLNRLIIDQYGPRPYRG